MIKPKTRSSPAAAELKDLRRIPGIGPSLARDLYDLGIKRVSALRGRDPESLYRRLCTLRGVHQDRCVLYTFRCAVYFANEPRPEPERLKWWNWQDAAVTSRPAPSRGGTRRRRAGSGQG